MKFNVFWQPPLEIAILKMAITQVCAQTDNVYWTITGHIGLVHQNQNSHIIPLWASNSQLPLGSGSVCCVSWKIMTAGHKEDTSMLSDWKRSAADFNSEEKWRRNATDALPRNWKRSLCRRSARVLYMMISDTASTCIHCITSYRVTQKRVHHLHVSP